MLQLNSGLKPRFGNPPLSRRQHPYGSIHTAESPVLMFPGQCQNLLPAACAYYQHLRARLLIE
ncbi:hypothetical protein D3C75_1195060 [compost metagenome]